MLELSRWSLNHLRHKQFVAPHVSGTPGDSKSLGNGHKLQWLACFQNCFFSIMSGFLSEKSMKQSRYFLGMSQGFFGALKSSYINRIVSPVFKPLMFLWARGLKPGVCECRMHVSAILLGPYVWVTFHLQLEVSLLPYALATLTTGSDVPRIPLLETWKVVV